jgi:hypothetical protein
MRQEPIYCEPVPIQDTLVTSVSAVESGHGFKVLECYREKRSPLLNGDCPVIVELVARIVIPDPLLPQFQRAVAMIGHDVPSSSDRLAHAETRGSA